MKKTKLTFEQVEQLQHILKHYMYEFKDHTSEKHYNELEVLKNKLIVMRAQAEYSKKWKNNSFLELERLKSEHRKCLEFEMYEKAAYLREEIEKKSKEAK